MSYKLEEAIMNIYCLRMSCSDICNQIKDIYGVNVSEPTVPNITNLLVEYPAMAGPAPGTIVMMNIEKKWTHPVKNWGLIISQFVTIFGNRCKTDELLMRIKG